MKYYLTVVALLLTFILLGGKLKQVESFNDIPKNHWAAKAVREVVNEKWMSGKSKRTFHGNRALTRYEASKVFAKILTRLIRLEQENNQLREMLQNGLQEIQTEKFKAHDEKTLKQNTPMPLAATTPPVVKNPIIEKSIKPVTTTTKNETIARKNTVKKPLLIYSYERLVSPLFSNALDDFRSIVEENIGDHRYSLSIKFSEIWDSLNKKEDLLSLGFGITLFRDESIVQESQSRKYSLFGLNSKDRVASLTLSPFKVHFQILNIYRENGRIKRVKLGIKIYNQYR